MAAARFDVMGADLGLVIIVSLRSYRSKLSNYIEDHSVIFIGGVFGAKNTQTYPNSRELLTSDPLGGCTEFSNRLEAESDKNRGKRLVWSLSGLCDKQLEPH